MLALVHDLSFLFFFVLTEVEATTVKEGGDLYDPMEIIDSPVIAKQQEEEEEKSEEVQPEVPVTSQAPVVTEEEEKRKASYESPTQDEPNASPIFPLVKDDEAIFPDTKEDVDEDQPEKNPTNNVVESIANDEELKDDAIAPITKDTNMDEEVANKTADTDVKINTSDEMPSTVDSNVDDEQTTSDS